MDNTIIYNLENAILNTVKSYTIWTIQCLRSWTKEENPLNFDNTILYNLDKKILYNLYIAILYSLDNTIIYNLDNAILNKMYYTVKSFTIWTIQYNPLQLGLIVCHTFLTIYVEMWYVMNISVDVSGIDGQRRSYALQGHLRIFETQVNSESDQQCFMIG